VFSPGIDLFATVFEDISRRKINEEERKLTIDIFKLLNAANSTQDLMKNVLSVLRSWSGCEAAGIRLREGEDFPYYEVQGFPELFVKKEMHLCERDLAGQIIRDHIGNPVLECMCGNIICGRFDPSKPFFTKSGSFWTNCTTELLASTTEADRQSRTRNRCNGEGYESVALIPLRAGGTVFGLIQLNDKQKNRFTRETIALYERLADSIGMALAQRKAAEALLASEKRLAVEKERLLVTLRSIGDAVITTDINGIITLMNRVAERLTGWELADAVGQPLNVVFHIINEKTRERCDNPVDRVLKTGGIVGLANHTALIARDGRELVIADSGAPIRDAQSNIIGVVLVFRDITVQRKTEEALRNTQRLESIGVLAGGIAHDFNNLLGGIFGYLSLAIDENHDKKTGQYLAKIMETMDRARSLTRQLLTFSKGGAPVRKRGPLFPFIQETAQFALSGANVSCFFDIEPGLRRCDFDKNQIGQAIDNIVINAQQAMPSGGAITITARNVLLAEQQVGVLKKGLYVRLSVKDTGIGIPSDILPRIFDPFFTTKQKGSGLGLATAFSIITRHEGYIEVQSSPGNGATFHVYLPAASEAGEIIPQEPLLAQHRGQGTIIIMDDEEVMRDTLSSMLNAYGYSVIQLHDGSEVLPRFKETVAHKQRPVAIILDLTVPGGMGGKEAGSILRSYDKTVPIFISSGYAEDPILANPENYGFTGSITKPYMKSELAALLEKLLRKSAK
jgi:PAS domain S-box-containing protein